MRCDTSCVQLRLELAQSSQYGGAIEIGAAHLGEETCSSIKGNATNFLNTWTWPPMEMMTMMSQESLIKQRGYLMDIVHDKVLWRKGSNMKASVPACHWIDMPCFHVFQPLLWINGKRWSTMAKGIRHVSLCPCVRVMLPSLSFLPTLPTPTGPTSTLYSVVCKWELYALPNA